MYVFTLHWLAGNEWCKVIAFFFFDRILLNILLIYKNINTASNLAQWETARDRVYPFNTINNYEDHMEKQWFRELFLKWDL